MTEPHDTKRSFWTTVPGIASGLAGVLGATAALLGILSSLGWVGSGDKTSTPSPALDKVRLLFAWYPAGPITTFKQFDVRFLPAGTRLVARCDGRGCFSGVRTRPISEAASEISLLGPPLNLRDLRLRPGASLELRYEHPEAGTKIWKITAVKGATQPRFDISCAPKREAPGPC